MAGHACPRCDAADFVHPWDLHRHLMEQHGFTAREASLLMLPSDEAQNRRS